MDWQYQIDPKKKVVEVTIKGVCQLPGLMACASKIFSDHDYRRDFDVILDLTQATSDLSHADIAGMAQYIDHADTPPIGRWTVLADTPKVTAFAMLYQRLAETQNVSLFCTRESALEFLGLASQEHYAHS